MRKVPRQLALRLILSLTVLVVVVVAVYTWVTARAQERQLLDEMVRGADQLSGSIASATWHAMLADHREAAYEVMQTIAQKQGIDRIRILNKEGRVTFSTTGEAGTFVDKNAEACYLCHARKNPLVRVEMPSRARLVRAANGRRSLGMITPIYNEPACSQAACHAHPPDRSVLGVLDISMDFSHVDREISMAKQRVVLMALAQVTLLSVFIMLFTRHFVGGPIRKLAAGMKAISGGDLNQEVRTDTPGELGELAAAFETMRRRLRQSDDELGEFTASLEQKVEERTRQLSLAQAKLVQSDRMASLGQLSASVAHEINNPISGVLNLAALLDRVLKDDGIPKGREPEFRRYLRQIIDETSRVGRIVSDLLSFSRRSSPQRAPADLNQIIVRTLELLAHRLRLGLVEIRTELSPLLPQIQCDSTQIQQVAINLILNAAEAIPGAGQVIVRTYADPDGQMVVLEIADSGSGIAPEHLPRIFDPFFTTKDEGKGVGLGLAVVYGIVQAHGGTIDVKSQPAKGTTFTIRLPLELAAGPRPVTVVRQPVAGQPG